MKRETFVSILSSLLAEADEQLLSEAKGLLFWRDRELRAEAIQRFTPGEEIEYVTPLGEARRGKIQRLNRFSVTIHDPSPDQGYLAIVVPLERIRSQPSEPRS